MELKRIVAPDMRTALKILREELGPDAIILSSKKVEQGVEIVSTMEMPEINPEEVQTFIHGVAGHEEPEQELTDRKIKFQHPPVQKVSVHDMFATERPAQEAAVQKTVARQERPQEFETLISREEEDTASRETVVEELLSETLATQQTPEQDITSREIEEQEIAALADVMSDVPRLTEEFTNPTEARFQAVQAELRGMRDLLQQQLSGLGWQQLANNNPVEASLWRRLDQMGLPAAVAKSCVPMLDQATSLETAWRFALGNLVNQISTTGDIAAAGGTYAFVGPTGVGKTTTIGKLAARYVLEHGADKVAILTTDTYRIGAHEQLRIIGRILHVPVKVVEDHRQLGRVLRTLSGKSLILIDTAGLTQKDNRLDEQLDSLAELEAQIQSYLVVAANSQLETMQAAYQTYKRAKIHGCVLTKLDETSSLGEAMGLLVEQQLKVAYITDGQEIPDDVKIARAVDLVSKSVSMMRRKGALDAGASLAEQIPALWMKQAVVNSSVNNTVNNEIAFN